MRSLPPALLIPCAVSCGMLPACAKGEDIAAADNSGNGDAATASDAPTDAPEPDAPAPHAHDASGDAPTEAAPCHAALVINEVQPAGPNGPDDEFIELHNPGTCPLPLDGYSLFYRSDDGTTDHLVWAAAAGQSMQASQFFVVGGKDFSGNADFPMGSNVALGASGGGLGLTLDDEVVDSVGWGDATNDYVEAVAAPVPAADRSIGR
ncbi:MAG: lamin tail domain-containing protein, partial [Myxococcota bacterium]